MRPLAILLRLQVLLIGMPLSSTLDVPSVCLSAIAIFNPTDAAYDTSFDITTALESCFKMVECVLGTIRSEELWHWAR